MKNDFRGKNAKGEELTISILPTLLVTAMSKATIKETQTSAFQKPNDLIYRIGIPSFGLTGSEFADHFFLTSESDVLPTIDPNANLALYRSIKKGGSQQMFSSIHDISDGGLICAVIESCFGNTLGCTIELTNPNQTTLFSEGPGQFVISISPDKETAFRTLFSDHNIQKLGSVTENPFVHITSEHNTHLNHPLDDFFHAWKEEL